MEFKKIRFIEPLNEKEANKLREETDTDMHCSTIDDGLTDQELNFEIEAKIDIIENRFKRKAWDENLFVF